MDSLPDPPTDGITSLKYLSQNASTSSKSLLASTSWDGCLRLHDTNLSTSILSHQMDSGPLMSLATIDHYVFTGGLDGSGMHTSLPNYPYNVFNFFVKCL